MHHRRRKVKSPGRDSRLETQIIKCSKKTKFILLSFGILSTLVTAIVSYLALTDGQVSSKEMGTLFVCASFMLAGFIPPRLLALKICDAGLKVTGLRLIPWEEIEEVALGTLWGVWGKYLFIKFKDPRRFMRKRPIMWFFNFLFVGGEDDFFLPLGDWELKPETIFSLIRERLEASQISLPVTE